MTDQHSVLDYYMKNAFNPVPLAVDTEAEWRSHFQKRLNLYERHLGIPFGLLRDRKILEFGCNTGENALVLAQAGAKMTLVEPNDQTRPLIEPLFRKHGLGHQLVRVSGAGIDDFESPEKYDLVVAEGFLYTMPNRDHLFGRLISFLAPGGLLVISSVDRHGLLLESLKRMILWRCLELSGLDDPQSPEALEVARRLFIDDFNRLNASRPFDAWVKDQLLNPFICSAGIWSIPELAALADQWGVVFQSCSPGWAELNRDWYKNAPHARQRHQAWLKNWARNLVYFITGRHYQRSNQEARRDMIADLGHLVDYLSDYSHVSGQNHIEDLDYPVGLDRYLAGQNHSELTTFNQDMKNMIETLKGGQVDRIINEYHRAIFRPWWGVPYQYLCFIKLSS